jgi:ABC-type multidrug transport system permease subunit
MSFLNTTKYPPSLHFLLMTMGPSLILLAAVDGIRSRLVQPIITLGGVPFFFYIVHLYVIHALAILLLVQQGGEASDYILSAREIMSGRLRNFGFELDVVYIIWIALIVLLYPLCKWYGRFKRAHRSSGWQSYLSRTL